MTLSACFLLVVGLATTMTARPARANLPDPQFSAATATLCWGYSGCARAGMGNAGYSSSNHHMYWRMYSGHNCTNYAAYRMVHGGMPNSRPWTGSGNATNWGVAMSRITDGRPAVGAVAWWRAYHRPAGSAGHVAYVERVVNSNMIIVSQDSWGGDFSWKQITRSGGQWPSGFVHFNDLRRLGNTVRPHLSGTPKVGATMTTTTGSWSVSGVRTRIEWRANGLAIPGGSARTLVLRPAQQGKRITARVFASKSGYPSTSAPSKATAPVALGTISNVAKPAIVGTPEVGQTLSADNGTWSPSGSTMTYSWRADGVELPGEDAATLQVGPELLGKVIGLRVMAEQPGYRKTGMRATRTPPVTAGTMTLSEAPKVSGVTRPGHTLTLEHGVPQPRDAQVRVQWLRDGVLVVGATRSTYNLSKADLGHLITAQVSATRRGYRKLVTTAAAPARVRSLPRLTTTTTSSRGTLQLGVTVAAPEVSDVNGVIGVRVRGVVVKTFRVQHGTGRATLRVPSGRQSVQLHFRRTDVLEPLDVFRTVQIP